VEKIDPDTLRNWLEDTDIFIMDVRNPNDWEASPAKIKNARRFDPLKFGEWARGLPQDKRLVLY
jgi:rhodanese-related sulfurtransferase